MNQQLEEIKKEATQTVSSALSSAIDTLAEKAFRAGKDVNFTDVCRLELILVNADNPKLSDKDFRDFVLTVLDDYRTRHNMVKK